MARYSLADWIAKNRRDFDSIVSDGTILLKAAATVHAAQMQRIFVNGIKSDGSAIGSYDTSHDLYINPRYAPRSFAPKGKYGETKFKKKEPHKTGYFTSYAAFRQSQGRPIDKINLVMFGRLQTDLSNGLKQLDSSTVISSVKNPVNDKKMTGNEKRFGKITNLTAGERKQFFDVFSEAVAERIDEMNKG